MGKGIAALLMTVASLGAATPASAAAVLFGGVLGIETASSACGILPYSEQGALFNAAYRPAGAGTNGPSTALTIAPMGMALTEVLISSFRLVNASLTNTFQEADVHQVTSTRRLSLNFEKYKTDIRLLQQTPGDVDGADFLALRLQVSGFGNVAGCTITLRGIMSDKATPKL